MSVRDIGNRSMGQLFNTKKRFAIIAISASGIILGLILFGI